MHDPRARLAVLVVARDARPRAVEPQLAPCLLGSQCPGVTHRHVGAPRTRRRQQQAFTPASVGALPSWRPCRRGTDGAELLHVPLEEAVLQQVLADVEAMS